MFGMGPTELMIIGVIAVLLFGSKLPEVAKSLGSSYREFKKGLSEFQSATHYDDSSHQSSSSSKPSYDYDEYDDSATAPRFEPPPEEGSTSDEGSSESATTTEAGSDEGTDSEEPKTS